MKKNLPFFLLLILVVITLLFSCKKIEKHPINPDLVSGKWSINSIRFQAFLPNGVIIDSTLPWKPKPENFVSFNYNTQLIYCYNVTHPDTGTYNYPGLDSITLSLNGLSTKYKVLLLTTTNMNLEYTLPFHHDFPGANKVVFFQSFVR